MKITDIQVQKKNPDRVSFFVDGSYSFSLTVNQLADEKIKVGDEVEEADVNRFKKLSEDGKLLQKTIDWCLRRPHSEWEVDQYLYRRADDDQKQMIKEKLDKLKFIEDSRFAEWWIEQRESKNLSKRKLVAELKGKKISQEIIDKVLEEKEVEDLDNLKLVIEKKRHKYPDDEKLIQFLMGRGFIYADIKSVLAED